MAAPLISKLEAFAKLSPSDRAALERLTAKSQREIAARRDLVREGDKPRSVFLLLDGWACRYKTLPDGRRQIVAFFVPGDLCDLQVFVLREMDHNVGAITTLKVAEVPREEFEALLETHPQVMRALWREEQVTLAVQREWTLNVGQRTAMERISHLFCELFLRLGAVGMTRGESCDFPLTQVDIADATGLTAVHVNRTLQELRRTGLIELQGRRLTIPDMDGLRSVAMFNDNYLHLNRGSGHLEAHV